MITPPLLEEEEDSGENEAVAAAVRSQARQVGSASKIIGHFTR